jgi:predicted nucleic acid binding AN1-type Zn finger protein
MHSSSPISRSTSPELAETMQIFVKNVSGESKASLSSHRHSRPLIISPAFPMTVPQDLSIRNLKTLLSIRTSLSESDLRLVYAGKHLLSSSTLADYNIHRESTLHLASPVRGGMPPKKIRCSYKDCKEGAQRIIGDCGFCQGHFCGKHRLLEDHKCDGLEDVSSPPIRWWLVGLSDELLANIMIDEQCKKESHDRNAAQLNAERTHVIKGI